MMELKEWAAAFIKHKDLAVKKIEAIENKGNELLIRQKDKKEINAYLAEKLDDSLMKKLHTDKTKMVFCPNVEENLKFLIKQWDKFTGINGLTIIFVNLKVNDKWVINPKLHSMIADPSSIEQGLKSMFDTANGKVDSGPGKRKPKMFDDDVADEDDSEEE